MPSPTGSSSYSDVDDTGNVTIDSLLGGTKWGGGAGSGFSLTFSFPSGSTYFDPDYSDSGEWSSWGPLTAVQMNQARAALQTWSNVANISFSETGDASTSVGDIRLVTFSGGADETAHAYYPGDYAAAGDVWLDRNDSSNTSPTPGSFGYTTLLHELGHALGLKHPFDPSPTLPPAQDNSNYTVMTYTIVGNPITPMLYDIQAIQFLYGANMSYHAGNDNYTLGGGALMQTIWDAGGTDTITMASAGTLDLRQGKLFNIGGVNYVIAYNTQIENGTGSVGNDVLIGNDASNILDGRGGVDAMNGGMGDDTYVIDNSGDTAAEGPGGGMDTVLSSATYGIAAYIENLTLTGSSNINGNGNSLDNILTGNLGINVLAGQAGNDTYIVQNAGDTIVENSGEGTDAVQSSVSYILSADVENLTLTGSSNINGNGNSLANVLTGNSGANTLAGGAGNDTYVIDALDTVIELSGQGIDTIVAGITYSLGANLENLTLTGTGNFNATGNALDNILLGNSGNNVLTGAIGNDTYGVDNAGDVVVENPGEGTDTVRSTLSYTLLSDFENLALMGTSPLTGTGNSGSNEIRGNGGHNQLFGGGGSDTYLGGPGFDTVFLPLARSNYLELHPGANTTFAAAGETQTLRGIERVHFGDGSELALRDSVMHFGDTNGDGRDDIPWRNLDGTVYIWNMNGTVLAGGGYAGPPNVTLDWSIQETGDFNGDGRDDILWRNDDGSVYEWLMNGTSLAGGGYAGPPNVTLDWSIQGTGDFNGDGRDDILWRNTNGSVYEWLMNGTALAGGGYAGPPNETV